MPDSEKPTVAHIAADGTWKGYKLKKDGSASVPAEKYFEQHGGRIGQDVKVQPIKK